MRPIGFGLLYTTAATIGQTLLISLFLPGIKASFGLGDAQVSLMFTLTTLASAVAVWKVGSWLDRTDLVRYATACGALLAASCVMMAASSVLASLIAGMFCLRLAGNGLLTHVAVTATARHYSSDRGLALSVVVLGASLGEGVLPAILLPVIAAFGWRIALIALGCFGLSLTIAGALMVRPLAAFRSSHPRVPDVASTLQDYVAGAKSDNGWYFTLTAALFAAMWLCTTATIFHQALIAQAKGLSLRWFAVSFVAFALVRAPVSILTGRLVDRIGSSWLFCTHLLPLAVGTIALIVVDAPWIAPFYWLCAGVTGGIGVVVQTTVVADRVPRERLGSARSALGAMGIVASAAGPTLYGVALAAGAGLYSVLWASVAFLLAATALGVLATAVDGKRAFS